MRSPPAAMRPPVVLVCASYYTPRRHPRKHPIMVKPCSRLYGAMRTFREAEDDRRWYSRGFPERAIQKKKKKYPQYPVYICSVILGAQLLYLYSEIRNLNVFRIYLGKDIFTLKY